jgi:hypothetical protein
VDTPLQVLKPYGLASRVECDDLAVQHQGGRRPSPPGPGLDRPRNIAELMSLLVAEPRPEPRAAGRVDLDDCPDAIVLGLVDEPGIIQRRVAQRRQHRTQT